MARGPNNSASSAATTPSPMEDPSSPYFLHTGDHPGLTLVSHTLTGPNFHSWDRAMTIALTAKNKLSFIDSSILRPAANALLFPSWNRCNSMVTSWILNSVSKDIADSLMYFSNAYDIWNDLHNRFQQANAPRLFQLKLHISSLHQGSLDINSYYTKLKILWDELNDYSPPASCTCGALRTILDASQKDQTFKFLMGLNDSFASIRAQILLMTPLLDLSRVFSLVLQEERHRQISTVFPAAPDTPLMGSIAAPSDSAPTLPPPASMTAAAVAPRRSRPFCTHCQIHGHTKERCFNLHGFPLGINPNHQGPLHPCPRPIPMQPFLTQPISLITFPQPISLLTFLHRLSPTRHPSPQLNTLSSSTF